MFQVTGDKASHQKRYIRMKEAEAKSRAEDSVNSGEDDITCSDDEYNLRRSMTPHRSN